jgi:hypothetical protein
MIYIFWIENFWKWHNLAHKEYDNEKLKQRLYTDNEQKITQEAVNEQ